MSLQCRWLLDSSIVPSLPGFGGALYCSLREASRKEQFIAPKNSFFGPIGTKKRAKIPYIRVLLVFQKRLDFLQAKEWFFRVFFRPWISGAFCHFIPCNLSRLSLTALSSERRCHSSAWLCCHARPR